MTGASQTLLMSAGWPMNAAIMFSRPRNFSTGFLMKRASRPEGSAAQPALTWGPMIWASRAALGAGGRNGADAYNVSHGRPAEGEPHRAEA
jgi:hypothetical protein